MGIHKNPGKRTHQKDIGKEKESSEKSKKIYKTWFKEKTKELKRKLEGVNLFLSKMFEYEHNKGFLKIKKRYYSTDKDDIKDLEKEIENYERFLNEFRKNNEELFNALEILVDNGEILERLGIFKTDNQYINNSEFTKVKRYTINVKTLIKNYSELKRMEFTEEFKRALTTLYNYLLRSKTELPMMH